MNLSEVQAVSTDEVEKYINPGFIYIICGCYRYGTQTFAVRLDFELPDLDSANVESDAEESITAEQEDLHMHVTNYAGLTWLVLGVDRRQTDFCHQLAEQIGFTMRRGVPKASSQSDRFPLHHSADSLYTLEYKTKPDPGELNKLWAEEKRWIANYLVRQDTLEQAEYESPDEESSVVVNLKNEK